MLISYSHRFLFIHIDKAAGTSIQRALQSYAIQKTDNLLRRRLAWLGPVTQLGGLYRTVEFREHVQARAVQRCLPPAIYAGMFKFAFVRNPWDRLVSRYSYLLRTTEHPRHKLVKAMKSFDEYLDWEIRRGKMFQQTFVTDTAGRLIVDYVGYFERIHEDFTEVCQRIGVQAELPMANISTHRDYRDYYTPATRDLVARAFAGDIEMFGYDFDSVKPQ
jgi:hypothetical protein